MIIVLPNFLHFCVTPVQKLADNMSLEWKLGMAASPENAAQNCRRLIWHGTS
jgi:hypothetical protein